MKPNTAVYPRWTPTGVSAATPAAEFIPSQAKCNGINCLLALPANCHIGRSSHNSFSLRVQARPDILIAGRQPRRAARFGQHSYSPPQPALVRLQVPELLHAPVRTLAAVPDHRRAARHGREPQAPGLEVGPQPLAQHVADPDALVVRQDDCAVLAPDAGAEVGWPPTRSGRTENRACRPTSPPAAVAATAPVAWPQPAAAWGPKDSPACVMGLSSAPPPRRDGGGGPRRSGRSEVDG